MTDSYETSDFYLACYLRCIGLRIVGTTRAGKRVTFKFAGAHDDVDRMKLAYYNGDSAVKPYDFVAAIRELRGLIYGTE